MSFTVTKAWSDTGPRDGRAVGGNIAGALLKKLSLGTVGNSIVGILGGGIGGQLLGMLGAGGAGAAAATAGGLDIGSIISSIAGGVLAAAS